VFAKAQVCPFVDHFTISNNSNNNTMIQSLRASGNLKVNQQNNTVFTAQCGNDADADSGQVFLTVNSTSGACHLTILDGPYKMNPSITSSYCDGKMQFSGVAHRSMYDYTLNFLN
jgi:hypothetical protein